MIGDWQLIDGMDLAPVKPLSQVWRPRPFQLHGGFDPEAIDAVWSELASRAASDLNQCCGYFPSLVGRAGIDSNFPASRRFAEGHPRFTVDGYTASFSFIRVSLRRQAVDPMYHLDTDAATAVTGNPATLSDRLARRVLLNLSPVSERVLHYLDLDPFTTALTFRSSYVCLEAIDAARDRDMQIAIPPRRVGTIHGLSFVANRVLHSGVDQDNGHFVAAYGLEAPTSAALDI